MSEEEILDKSTEMVEDTLRNTLDLIEKLQQELQAEKEKNKELENIVAEYNKRGQTLAKYINDENSYMYKYIAKDWVRKDKIKDLMHSYSIEDERFMKYLQELLDE